jgi:iron(III) transport system permease protein
VMPLFVLIWTSLAPRFTAFSIDALHLLNLNAYRKLLGNADLWIAVKNTFTISFSATVIGMLIATLVSWLSVRGGMKWALLPERIMYLVLGVPGVVLCLALMFTYVSIPIPIYGTIWIIVLGFVIVSLPFGSGLMNGAFLQIHKQLEEAAAVSGAGLWATFTQIAFFSREPDHCRPLMVSVDGGFELLRCLGHRGAFGSDHHRPYIFAGTADHAGWRKI